MSLDEATRERIAGLIARHRVLLFMKGNRRQPQCGFSARVVGMLDDLLSEYETVDVLSDPGVREGIKVFSSWPTIPQLYVGGEFVGGCDIVTELYESGELHEKLGVEKPEWKEPSIRITDAAAEALRQAAGGRELHLKVDARFQAQLFLAPAGEHDVAVQSNGVTLHLDRSSCARADGLVLDVEQSANGPAFKIDNPNAPHPVRQMTPGDLKRRLDAGEKLALFDVRTPGEHAQASIRGARLVDAEVAEEIARMDKDALLVFHCHHGGRSQAAAEHFREQGFRNVWNLAGGIDAWSREVDPSVPRY
jgi:monothiol glutaredoxin